MRPEDFIGANAVWLVLAALILLAVWLAIRIVPQSEKHVVERFGRLHAVLGPGINLIIPFLDQVAHRISILERQLPNASQDAITADNVLLKVETSVFFVSSSPKRPSIASATWTAPSPRRWPGSCAARSASSSLTRCSRTGRI
jgi:regulator of protease activity HflC (stomatin/prohibitin superfamily)